MTEEIEILVYNLSKIRDGNIKLLPQNIIHVNSCAYYTITLLTQYLFVRMTEKQVAGHLVSCINYTTFCLHL